MKAIITNAVALALLLGQGEAKTSETIRIPLERIPDAHARRLTEHIGRGSCDASPQKPGKHCYPTMLEDNTVVGETCLDVQNDQIAVTMTHTNEEYTVRQGQFCEQAEAAKKDPSLTFECDCELSERKVYEWTVPIPNKCEGTDFYHSLMAKMEVLKGGEGEVLHAYASDFLFHDPYMSYMLVDMGCDCPEVIPRVAQEPKICPQYVRKEEEGETLDPEVPRPEKCVMKRKDELLNFEPNFPSGRPDVYIEVEIGSGERFQFYPHDYPEFDNSEEKKGSIPFVDKEVFQILFDEQEKLGGQGFKLRYVSKNGPGEWNSCKYSPIAFDLNGNGKLEMITAEGGFEIDVTGDGDVEHLKQWFDPQEGILIDAHNQDGLDDFENGVITGDHMMGDMGGKYTDGFAKLATYDDNCDDKLTGKELDGLYIWMDKNSNLILDEGELFTLSDFGIVELSTIHDDLKSHAVLSDGSTMLMQDLWFDEFGSRRNLRSRN